MCNSWKSNSIIMQITPVFSCAYYLEVSLCLFFLRFEIRSECCGQRFYLYIFFLACWKPISICVMSVRHIILCSWQPFLWSTINRIDNFFFHLVWFFFALSLSLSFFDTSPTENVLSNYKIFEKVRQKNQKIYIELCHLSASNRRCNKKPIFIVHKK